MAKAKEEPQTDMTVGDALNVIGQFKGVWRALEKIEDALLVASRAEGRAAELEAKNKEHEEKTVLSAAAYNTKATELAAKEQEFANFEADLEAKKAAATRKYEDDMVELGKHYSETSVAARDKVAADLKAEQERVNTLTTQKSDFPRDPRLLEAEVATLPKKKAEL